MLQIGGHLYSDAILDHFRPLFALAPSLNRFLLSKKPYIQDFMFLAQKLPPQLNFQNLALSTMLTDACIDGSIAKKSFNFLSVFGLKTTP